MVCNPYPFDHPVMLWSNCSGVAYGISKGFTLLSLGAMLYEPAPARSDAILSLSSAAVCLLAAAFTAGADWKAEHAWERLRHPSNPNEKMSRANWVALWTCYSLAAQLYGKPTASLARQDLKILAIKIAKIVAILGAGIFSEWGGTGDGWNWKVTVGTSMLLSMGTILCLLPLLEYYEAIPSIYGRARVLLEAAIEISPEPSRIEDPNARELRPILPRSFSQRNSRVESS